MKGRPTDIPSDTLSNTPIDRPTQTDWHRLTDWPTYPRARDRPTDQPTDQLTDPQTNTNWLMTDQSICTERWTVPPKTDQTTKRMTEWWPDKYLPTETDRLTNWWLTDQPTNRPTNQHWLINNRQTDQVIHQTTPRPTNWHQPAYTERPTNQQLTDQRPTDSPTDWQTDWKTTWPTPTGRLKTDPSYNTDPQMTYRATHQNQTMDWWLNEWLTDQLRPNHQQPTD